MELKETLPVQLVGILNVTPDSFSDGGSYFYFQDAVKQAKKLASDGANIIEIGGDSTRPGSVCVEPTEEWNRIKDLIKELSKSYIISVDTHHAEVALKAIEAGATYINDISAGSDCDMFKVVAEHNIKYVMMYSRCSCPHVFDEEPRGDIIKSILRFFMDKIEDALASGIKHNQIILDPGMGAFISSNESLSWELIGRFKELENLPYPLMLGVSRKGFLRNSNEDSIDERDKISGQIANWVLNKSKNVNLQFLRVHDVAVHVDKILA